MDKNELLQKLKIAFDLQNAEELELLARQAVEDYEHEAFGYSYLAESLLLRENIPYDKVMICVAKAYELSENVDFLVKLADIKEMFGAYEDAVLLYQKALEIQPNNSIALSSLGLYYLRIAETADEAILYFDRAIAAADNQDAAIFYSYRAEAYYALDDISQAAKDIDACLAIRFDAVAASLKIAILKRQGKEAETEAVYMQLIENCPDAYAYSFDFGVDLLGKNRPKEALTHLQKTFDSLAQEDKLNNIFLLPLGQAYLGVGDFTKSLEILESCQERDAESLEILLMIAQAQMGLKRYTDALASIDKMAKLAKQDEYFVESLQFNRAKIWIEMGEISKAKAIYKQFEEDPAYEVECNYGLGLVNWKQNNLPAAYTHLKFAAQNNMPEAVELIKSYFGEYLKQQADKVFQQYKNLLDNNQNSPIAKQLNGTLWQFEAFKTPDLEGAPDEMLQEVNSAVRLFSFIFSDNAIVMSMGEESATSFYQIEKEKDGMAQVRYFPTDGSEPKTVKLKLEAESLSYNPEEGNFFRLRKVSTDKMYSPAKIAFKQQFNVADWSFMNHLTQPLIDNLLK
jgi:tetratricopeptide (TPR) repeat protein